MIEEVKWWHNLFLYDAASLLFWEKMGKIFQRPGSKSNILYRSRTSGSIVEVIRVEENDWKEATCSVFERLLVQVRKFLVFLRSDYKQIPGNLWQDSSLECYLVFRMLSLPLLLLLLPLLHPALSPSNKAREACCVWACLFRCLLVVVSWWIWRSERESCLLFGFFGG